MIVATYNVHFGYGVDGRDDLRRIADEVAGADIVCFQEVAQHWRRNDGADQAATLAGHLNFHYVFGGSFDVDAGQVAADGRVVNRRRRFGNMVASRWPIVSSRTLPLPKPGRATEFDLQRCAVEAVVDAPEFGLRLYSVHLSHISQERRFAQIEALLDFVRRAPAEGSAWDHTRPEEWTEGWETPLLPAPALIMGDMNFLAESPEYTRMLVGGDDGADLRDAWVLAGHPAGEGVSHYAKGNTPCRVDHAFVTADVAPRVRRAWIDNDACGSDHYPLFLEFAAD